MQTETKSVADAFATELTELTNKHIELGLTTEKAASVFTHAADSALDCLKWEPMITRKAHEKIKDAAMLLNHHWQPNPPNEKAHPTAARATVGGTENL